MFSAFLCWVIICDAVSNTKMFQLLQLITTTIFHSFCFASAFPLNSQLFKLSKKKQQSLMSSKLSLKQKIFHLIIAELIGFARQVIDLRSNVEKQLYRIVRLVMREQFSGCQCAFSSEYWRCLIKMLIPERCNAERWRSMNGVVWRTHERHIPNWRKKDSTRVKVGTCLGRRSSSIYEYLCFNFLLSPHSGFIDEEAGKRVGTASRWQITLSGSKSRGECLFYS